jgi:WD40 repeat protein/serine/threonine protein kinase
MAEREGQQFGNYRLVRLLGKGSFAEVHLGEQIYLGTQAAIKLLHTHLIAPSDVEAFRVEARTVATLVHPSIVRVLDFGVQDGTPYLVMDYAPNGSLRQVFRGGVPIAPATIAPYLRQIAEALQYAHDQRLIHRDVKPENMLIGSNRQVLLSDFGIATFVQPTGQQSTQAIAGTAAYMAPEQIQGHPRPASDQYSLGVVAYEWLVGERPFQGAFNEIASQHLFAPPPSLLQRAPGLPPPLEHVIQRALAKDPKQRFDSVRAFAAAFEQASQGGAGQETYATRLQPEPPPAVISPAGIPSEIVAPSVLHSPTVVTPPRAAAPGSAPQQGGWASAPVGASPTGWYDSPTFSTAGPASPVAPAPPPTPPEKRISRRAFVLAGASGVVLLAGGGTLLVFSLHSGGHTPQGGPTATAAANPSASASAGASPTATTTKTAGPTATTGPGALVTTYTSHSGEVDTVAWSPNGDPQVASGSFDHTARVWDATGAGTKFTYSKHTDQVWAVAWSPNGKYIASGSRDKSVQVWDATNGSQITVYTGHSDAIEGVAWSPDSTKIASASYDNTVRVWVALTQNFVTTFMGHSDHVWAVDWSPDGTKVVSGGKDNTVQVWDATTNPAVTLYTYTRHTDGVSGVAWSPDGSRIASASYDGTVQVWNATNGGNVVTYRGHSAKVTAVDWSPDGQRLVSSSADGTAQMWDANGTKLFTYRGHQGTVDAVAWSPDGNYIVSSGTDQTAQVWRSS